MAEYSDRLRVLLNRYANNNTTPVEENDLFDLLSRTENAEIEPMLTAILEQTESMPDAKRRERILGMIFRSDEVSSRNSKSGVPVRKVWQRWAVAASVLLVVGLGAYFLFFNETGKPPEILKVPELPNDVKAPDENRAMITLADGSRVYLDSVSSGQLAMQGNVKLMKLGNGEIAYQTASGEMIKEVQYNTLFNPKGSQVATMTLADGSKVWLNAGSSVTFPIAFVGNERKVSITGEAYFEVAPSAREGGQNIPFIVKINTAAGDGGEIEVLGTHFNINAYDDEPTIKTTLLEGSVKVTKGRAASLLKPGQQAQLAKNGEIKLLKNADVEEAVAWKNGMFAFNETDLRTIMRQVMRWYDVDVVFEGNTTERYFTADISRNTKLSEFLKVLEESKIHFKIEGKKITVIL